MSYYHWNLTPLSAHYLIKVKNGPLFISNGYDDGGGDGGDGGDVLNFHYARYDIFHNGSVLQAFQAPEWHDLCYAL